MSTANPLREKAKVPKGLQSARRSLLKEKISTPVSFPTRHTPSIAPPKKVIKALYDYEAKGPQELSFSQGDFFHVVGKENDRQWYEACNPATNSKGLVPVNFFQVLEKAERILNDGNSIPTNAHTKDSGFVDLHDANHPHSQSKRMQPLYGIVLYDFQAERADELQAKAGEPIIVIAQSNLEWFVAKPIGRLGGPGLIPVSFVEIRDAVTGRTITNVADLMQNPSTPIPKVEEWKKMTQGYEASSILLGSIEKQKKSQELQQRPERPPTVGQMPPLMKTSQEYGRHPDDLGDEEDVYDHYHDDDGILDSYGMQRMTRISEDSLTLPKSRSNSPLNDHDAYTDQYHDEAALVISASVDSYILEGDQYWFIVYADLANNRHRVLYRLYEDFYDFQINLLHQFPAEAGKKNKERILPYMPGPLAKVDEEITAERRRDLDKYCKDLLALPRYLAECYLVQEQLFGINEGDIETDYDPRTGRSSRDSYSAGMDASSYQRRQSSPPPPKAPVAEQPPVESRAPARKPSSAGKQVSPNRAPPGGQPTQSTVKVKIIYRDDIIAFRVAANCRFGVLSDKITERLGFEPLLTYKDEYSGERLPLENEADMDEAFQVALTSGKLTVFAS
ncbi:bud emergence protein 1 [Umbelopsis sp. WA50703]